MEILKSKQNYDVLGNIMGSQYGMIQERVSISSIAVVTEYFYKNLE